MPGHDEWRDSCSPSASIQRPFAVGTVEREGRHVDLEPLAALAHHLVAAGHEARRGRKRHAAGIFEALARREHGLLADHAFAADFLLAARGVGNDPVPRPQLHRLVAAVGDDDGIGPEILAIFDRRAFRQEVRLHGDFDLAGNGAVHAGDLPKSLKASYRKVQTEPIAGPVWTASVSLKLQSSFQHSSNLKRPAGAPPATYLACNLRAGTILSCKADLP